MIKEMLVWVGIGVGVLAGGLILINVLNKLELNDHLEKCEYEILKKEDLNKWFNDYRKTAASPFKGFLAKKSDMDIKNDSDSLKGIINDDKNFLTQSILDKDENVIKTRLVYYTVLEEPLRQMFVDIGGPVIIEYTENDLWR